MKLDDANQFRLPTKNEIVVVQGLVSASQWNDHKARILNYDPETGRYGIQLLLLSTTSDKKKKLLSVRPCNLQLLDDVNKQEWDDRLVHVFIPCHVGDTRRVELFRQCVRSLILQHGRCRVFVGVSSSSTSTSSSSISSSWGSGEDDDNRIAGHDDDFLRRQTMDILRVVSTSGMVTGQHQQWFVIEQHTRPLSQFHHFKSLFDLSFVINPHAWIMFCDNDDMYDINRIKWFQESATELQDETYYDGFWSGGKLLIDEKRAQEIYGKDVAIPIDKFIERDDTLSDIVEVAATYDENADKDVLEYFDFCIRSSVMNRFLRITPDKVLAHRFCDCRFGDTIQKLHIENREHPVMEWLIIHYRLRLIDRHELFLNRDIKSGQNHALSGIVVSDDDVKLSDETGLDPILIAYGRKDVEESVIIMVERDDVGLEHRRKLRVLYMDRDFGSNIGTRLWEQTVDKFSSYFTEEQARKCRLWASTSKQQNYSLEEDMNGQRNY
jgi:type III secretion system FlhB-like substrate exporter